MKFEIKEEDTSLHTMYEVWKDGEQYKWFPSRKEAEGFIYGYELGYSYGMLKEDGMFNADELE